MTCVFARSHLLVESSCRRPKAYIVQVSRNLPHLSQNYTSPLSLATAALVATGSDFLNCVPTAVARGVSCCCRPIAQRGPQRRVQQWKIPCFWLKFWTVFARLYHISSTTDISDPAAHLSAPTRRSPLHRVFCLIHALGREYAYPDLA